MKFKIGDKVAVIDDIIRGKVVEISKSVVYVMDEDKMKYQFEPCELVKVDIDQTELSKFIDINNPLLKQKIKATTKKKSAFKKVKKDIIMEVDLHIEKLVKSTRNMDNFDILSKQLDTAKFKIEYCIKNRIPKLVFIHGVGEGILKSELKTVLNRYDVTYYDASYNQYGLGATEVKIC